MPCIFCEASGTLSGEHIWPKWIRKRFPPAPSNVRHAIKAADQMREWRAPPFTQTVRDICKPCNMGWMNDLEIAVQPLLTPMFRGHGKTIHADGQRILAAWALKTCMMCALAHSGPRIIPLDHYRKLYATRTKPQAPDGVFVRLAGYGGQRHSCYYEGHGLTVTFPGTVGTNRVPDAPAYGMTLAIGYACFHVFGSEAGLQIDFSEHPKALTRPIWPAGASFTWPVAPLLTDDGLIALGRFVGPQ